MGYLGKTLRASKQSKKIWGFFPGSLIKRESKRGSPNINSVGVE